MKKSGTEASAETQKPPFSTLMLGALGIVFGDIGTSPLYAINEVFFGRAHVALTPEHILGVISCVVWALVVIVAIKYTLFVLRADNDGEGGVFALYGLLHALTKKRHVKPLLLLLLIGSGFLLGASLITPAISVMAAVEGLNTAEPALAPMILPLTICILTGLFAIQSKGTARVGAWFGPILLIWFAAIAFFGLLQIVQTPAILAAFNPVHAVRFLIENNFIGVLLVMGGIMLVLTGGEAMYADMGFFGANPIRASWFAIVFPALLLNYLGQGAHLLSGEPITGNLFYSLIPAPLLYPSIILATLATVIASQAMISGSFSLSAQAIRLGLLPRMKILFTHASHAGQVYVPFVNWALYLGCIILVLCFRSSSALATTYGLAVSGDMAITSLAMLFVARYHWAWSRVKTLSVFGCLLIVDLFFLTANSLNFLEGGYVPVCIGIAMFFVMLSWEWGRHATAVAYSAKPTMTVAELIELSRNADHYTERSAVLMIPKRVNKATGNTPALLQLLWDRHGILPRHLIFVHVEHVKVPYLHDNRYDICVFERSEDKGSIVSVTIRFGFMEDPNVEDVLDDLAQQEAISLPSDKRKWIVYVSREHLVPSKTMSFLTRLFYELFRILRQNSVLAYYYYGLGDKVQMSAEIMPVRLR